MKTLLAILLVVSAVNTALANSCDVEVDGHKISPLILHDNSATVANENGNSTVLVTCGNFTGFVYGVERSQNLQQGECVILSNLGQIAVIGCE